MKNTIFIGGKEIEVRPYERTKEFNEMNSIPENEMDELVTDGENIYMWIDASGEFKRIWNYI